MFVTKSGLNSNIVVVWWCHSSIPTIFSHRF